MVPHLFRTQIPTGGPFAATKRISFFFDPLSRYFPFTRQKSLFWLQFILDTSKRSPFHGCSYLFFLRIPTLLPYFTISGADASADGLFLSGREIFYVSPQPLFLRGRIAHHLKIF